MTGFQVPLDCVQVSLSLDRNLLSSLSSQNLELYLMNKLLSQCLGTLSFTVSSPNESKENEVNYAASLQGKEQINSNTESEPNFLSELKSEFITQGRSTKRKCTPGQRCPIQPKILPRKEVDNAVNDRAPINDSQFISQNPSFEPFCPKVTNVISCNGKSKACSDVFPGFKPMEGTSIMDLSPETNRKIVQCSTVFEQNAPRVIISQAPKVIPSVAPPLRVQVPCSEVHSRPVEVPPIAVAPVRDETEDFLLFADDKFVDDQISSIGDEFRALFPPDDDEDNEISSSSNSELGSCQPLLQSDGQEPIFVKTENLDDYDDENSRFLSSAPAGLQQEDSLDFDLKSDLNAAYDTFSMADDEPSCSSSSAGANNDAIDNMAILDHLFNDDNTVKRDTVIVTPGKPPSDLRPIKPKISIASPCTVSVIANNSNNKVQPATIKILGTTTNRQRIRSKVGTGSRSGGSTARKRQNRLRINCSICSYNSDRGANVVRHYVLVHKLPDPVAKIVVKGLRTTAINGAASAPVVKGTPKLQNIAPKIVTSEVHSEKTTSSQVKVT